MARCELSQVSCKYGAPMGRGGCSPAELLSIAPDDYRMRLQRIVLRGDYDSGGAYWGAGQPLWRAWYIDEDGYPIESFFRARSRDEAKAQFPGRRFYR